jgi:hypothetical protein
MRNAILIYCALMVGLCWHLKTNFFARVESPPKTGAFKVADIEPFSQKSRLITIKGELDESGWHVSNSTQFKRLNMGHMPVIMGMQAVSKNLRYRTLSVITVGNLKGYGLTLMIVRSELMCVLNIILRGPNGTKLIKHDLTPNDWPQRKFEDFQHMNLDSYIHSDGFLFTIQDDQTAGMGGLNNNPGKTFTDFKWFRGFKLEIPAISLKIQGSVVKAPHTNMYSAAHPFYKNDRRYWKHTCYLYNLVSAAEWTYENETVKLQEEGDKSVFGDLLSEHGVYPYKLSSYTIEWNLVDAEGELVTFKVGDGGVNDLGVSVPRDQVCVGNEWTHLEPTRVSYTEGGDPWRIRTMDFDGVDVLKMDIEVRTVQPGARDEINLVVVQADTVAKSAIFNGWWIDGSGVRHTVENATGFWVFSYIQM